MESGRAVPPELEGSIHSLSERLDRMQLSQGDQLALGALEDRIAKLSEKLDASDSRLGQPRRTSSAGWPICWSISRRCARPTHAARVLRRFWPSPRRPLPHRRPFRQRRNCTHRRW